MGQIRRLLSFLSVSLAVVKLLVACQNEPPPVANEPLALDTATRETVVTPPEDEEWLLYTIPAGAHRNDQRAFSFFEGDHLRFNFRFDSTAIYQTNDPSNQADWNKLMGFSDCSDLHQKNSIRLVWRWYEERLQLGVYRYSNGEREYATIGAYSLGETHYAEVVARKHRYEIRLDTTRLYRPRSCQNSFGRYWLFPYFGGDEVAPHKIQIAVQHLP